MGHDALCDAQEFHDYSVSAEFQACSLDGVTPPGSFSTAGLFAGVGGIELGLHQAGAKTELLCEWWEPAQQFWPNASPACRSWWRGSRPATRCGSRCGGVPCTDLSQAGRTKGINGEASGQVKFSAWSRAGGRRSCWRTFETYLPSIKARLCDSLLTNLRRLGTGGPTG